MIISAIKNFNIYNNSNYSSTKQENNRKNVVYLDSFVKSNAISFQANYENMFPPSFFDKLMQEGIQCAYTGVKLIPKENFRTLRGLGDLIKPIPLEIDYLKGFKDYLYEFEQKILNIIVQDSQKTHKKNIYKIFKNKKHESEANLRKKQLNSLNKLLIESRRLPQRDYEYLRNFVLNYIKLLTEQNASGMILEPSALIRILKKINCTDEKLEKKLKKIIQNIPTEETSTDAYIMKYATGKNGKWDQKHREISLNLLQNTVGSNEHFWPRERYKADAKGKDPFMFTILTSSYVNHLKGNMTPDEFIKKYRRFKIKDNMQSQVDRLKEIYYKWEITDPINAQKLKKYILTYKYETEKHSKLVKINIEDFIAKLNSSPQGAEEFKKADAEVKKLLNL